jgi:RNA polymerase sigma-70 factor (ECF subfamily)
MAPISDAEALIRSARDGSPEALNELLTLYRAQIRYEAGIRLEGALKAKMDSSDAAQNVLLRATERFEQFRGDSEREFTAWLRSILANHLRDEQRRYRGESRSVSREVRLHDLEWFDGQCEELLAAAPDETASEAERRELSLRVAAALERLPAESRDLLVLRGFDHLEWAEIARRTGTSPDAARMRWSRALHLLGFQLREYGN